MCTRYIFAITTLSTLFLICCNYYGQCITVVMEQSNVTFFSDKYFNSATMFVHRYGRRSKYYFNVDTEIKKTIGNNVTLHVLTFEYLHNEYRRSFAEMHDKLCNVIMKDPLVGGLLRSGGMRHCPIVPGNYKFDNMTVPLESIPSAHWPLKKSLVKVSLAEYEEQIFSADVYCRFEDDPVQGKKKLPKVETKAINNVF